MTTKEKMKTFVKTWQKVKSRKQTKLKKKQKNIEIECVDMFNYRMFKYGIIKKRRDYY